MKYREMIKKVQHYSGFSDKESRDALEMMVESLAVHLTEGERKDFASQLPQELQNIALAVYPTEETSQENMLDQFVRMQQITRDRAKKQMLSAWQTMKDALSKGQIEHIRAQLPKPMVQMLH